MIKVYKKTNEDRKWENEHIKPDGKGGWTGSPYKKKSK